MKAGKCKAPLVKQFEWLSVSSSGYYDWISRLDKPVKRNERSRVIDEAIRIAFEDQKQRYGSPRLHVDFNESGFPVALDTVAESMRRQDLVAKAGRKFKATTNSRHNLPVSPNLPEQGFFCKKFDEKWEGDIFYLIRIVNLYGFQAIFGWTLTQNFRSELSSDYSGEP